MERGEARGGRFMLVAVTERALCPDSFFARLDALVAGGFDQVVLREKDLDAAAYARLVQAVLAFSADPEALLRALVVHAHTDVARELGIPRVQLPLPVLEAACGRTPDGVSGGAARLEGESGLAGEPGAVGASRLEGTPRLADTPPLEGLARVGVSVHSVEEARRALSLGATALVTGHVFESGCKPGVAPRGVGFLRAVVDVAQGAETQPTASTSAVPVLAIGGIAPATIAQAAAAGASGACVRQPAMEDPDPLTLAGRLRQALRDF